MTAASMPNTSPRTARTVVFGKLNLLGAIIGAVALAAAWGSGTLDIALALALMVAPLVMAGRRAWHARRGDGRYGLLRQPLRRGHRAQLAQCLNQWLFLLLAAATILTGAFAGFAVSMSNAAYAALVIAVWAGIVAIAALALVSRRRVFIATNVLVALGSAFLAFQLVKISLPPQDSVAIHSPSPGEWYVFSGGRSDFLNTSHSMTSSQRDALDTVRVVDGRTYEGDKGRLESYFAFGEPVLAAAGGRVTVVVDGLPDQSIGDSDRDHPEGNHLVIDIGSGRYLLMGHLRRGSVTVKRGDRVLRGQSVAQVGNSGNTSEPHLHLQIQDKPTFADVEASVRTYPIVFRDVVVTRGGEERTPDEADVRRGDRFRPIEG